MLASDARKIGHEFFIELLAARAQRRIVTLGAFKQLVDRNSAVLPERQKAIPKIFDGIDFVVRQQEMSRDRFDTHRAQRKSKHHHRPVIVRGMRHARVHWGIQLPVGKELSDSSFPGRHRFLWRFTGGSSHVEKAPVDADRVASPSENRLGGGPHPQRAEPRDVFAFPGHRLIRRVHHEFGAVIEVNLHLVMFSIQRANLPG